MPSNSKSGAAQTRVMMVCLGNICRSPMAEAVLAHHAKEAGLSIKVDSSGTGDWHIGQNAHANTLKVLKERGYSLKHTVKQFKPKYFNERDLIIAMDLSNFSDLEEMAEEQGIEADIRLLREFDPQLSHLPKGHRQLAVPDPYHHPLDKFRNVLNMVEAATTGLVSHLARN
jgi:protein-tyrosine phosphatase